MTLASLLLATQVTATAGELTPVFDLHLGRLDIGEPREDWYELALGLGVGIPLEQFLPNLQLNVEFFGWLTELPYQPDGICAFCQVNDELDIGVTSFGASLAGLYPADSAMRAYASVGVACAIVDFRLNGSIFGFPGTYEEDRDTTLGWNYGLGLLYDTGAARFGLHWRVFDYEAASAEFDVGAVDVGGEYLGVSLSWPL